MHIAFLVQDIEGKSGWSRYARDMTRALHRRGHRITVLVQSTANDAPWCTQIRCLRPPLHCLSICGCLLQYLRLRIILAKLSPDIVHIVAEPYALLMGFMPKKYQCLLTIHGSYGVIPFRAGHFVRWATQRAWKRMQRIISVSAFTKKYVQSSEPDIYDRLGLERKIVIIPNAINLDPVMKKGPSHTMYRILGVGAVKERKGYLEALQALAALRKHIDQPFRYDIIGSTNDVAYVRRLHEECQRLGLTNEVHIRGTVPEDLLIQAYRDADAFLLLSTFHPPYVEGFVLAFLEAAAASVPSVGPTTGGCPEAIAHGRSGYTCDPNDSETVATYLAKILQEKTIDPQQCRAWAESHNINDAAREMEHLYLHAIASASSKYRAL